MSRPSGNSGSSGGFEVTVALLRLVFSGSSDGDGSEASGGGSKGGRSAGAVVDDTSRLPDMPVPGEGRKVLLSFLGGRAEQVTGCLTDALRIERERRKIA